MKQIDNKEKINRIFNMEEKQREELSLRRLWRECFGDPPAYEDFYFSYVYPGNIVYTIQDKGMLHLNPYTCMVQGREISLHYIVGVATRKSERRKGIMRRMLYRALTDMYQDKEPFTYLMPADIKYYRPFHFVSISKKQETVLTNKKTDHLCFVKYREILELPEPKKQQELFRYIDQMLSDRYDIFAKHDQSYFDLLLKEKECQDGDVVFCFDGEAEMGNFEGFFAYGMENQNLLIEQYLLKDERMESCLAQYDKEKTLIVHKFPFMVRIVHVEAFLVLFAKQFYKFAIEEKRLLVTDPVLSDNNGIYAFSIMEKQIFIKKQEARSYDKKMWDERMTVEQLADFIFGQSDTEENKVFFAEVV